MLIASGAVVPGFPVLVSRWFQACEGDCSAYRRCFYFYESVGWNGFLE